MRTVIAKLASTAFAVLVVTLTAIPAHATQPQRTFWVFGAGTSSCATALSDEHQIDTFAWIVGYFTGMNRLGGTDVGKSTDGNGIVGEVKLVCEAEPSAKFVYAVDRVYARMRDQGR